MRQDLRRNAGRCIRTGLCVAALAGAGAAMAADGATIGIGATASRGDYGTDLATTIATVPLELRVREGRWTLGATVSWLRVDGDADVVPSAGPLPLLAPITGAPDAEDRTTSGVGDVVLTGKYTVDTGGPLGLDVGAKAKLAVADEARGLGTGANDYGVSLDLYRDVAGTLVFAGAEREWLGESSRVTVDQAQRFRAGLSHGAGRGRLGAMVEQRSALASAHDDRRDATAFYSVPTASGGQVQLHVSRGLSDSSPDWGAGVSISAGL